MDWTIILTIVFTGLAAILAAIAPFFIAWLLKQKVVQQLHLEGLIQAVVPQVVEWVEWWAAHWNDKDGAPPKGELKMNKALELIRIYIPTTVQIPDEILKLKFETALDKLRKP